MQPLFDPAEFRIAAGITHVCAGGETAVLCRRGTALDRCAADKGDGMPGRAAHNDAHDLDRLMTALQAEWG